VRNCSLIPGRGKSFFSFPECPSWPPIQWTVGVHTPGGRAAEWSWHFHVVLKQENKLWRLIGVEIKLCSELIIEQYLEWILTETEFYKNESYYSKSRLNNIYERNSEFRQLNCIPATIIQLFCKTDEWPLPVGWVFDITP
jgi:hypothetical protein